MNTMEAILARHSVRIYENKPLAYESARIIETLVSDANRESGLHIQLVKNEPKAFDSAMAHYGKFSGVSNYLAMIGRKYADLEEKCGYYGEKIVLEMQKIGLNSCWVALTFKKIPDAYQIDQGEKLAIVIALGYGKIQGTPHVSKTAEKVSNLNGSSPEWFKRGVDAALLAPTAMNQQKFRFDLDGNRVRAKAGFGFYTKIDLGIAKYHFETGAGKGSEIWL